MYISHMGPDVCVGEIFQALLAFSNKSGFKKVFSHVVPHLLEVIGGKMTRRPPVTFVFNFQIRVAAPPVFNKSLMVLAIFTAFTAAGESRCLKHSHTFFFSRKCVLPL